MPVNPSPTFDAAAVGCGFDGIDTVFDAVEPSIVGLAVDHAFAPVDPVFQPVGGSGLNIRCQDAEADGDGRQYDAVHVTVPHSVECE